MVVPTVHGTDDDDEKIPLPSSEHRSGCHDLSPPPTT
jgi:hypothetical protein